MGAQVARNVTVLSLEGALDLPTLTIVSLALAGALQHVHTLRLDTSRCGAGGFRNLYALHSALRGAFPALQELCLPAMACLRGLVAFAGSALHTVRVIMGSPGCLCQSHVRSLLRLSQLRHLDLDGAGWDAMWDDANDDDAWDALNADDDAQDDADEGIPAGADEELALGDATLEEALPGLTDEALQEMWALRRLLASTPPALESLRLNITFQEINFVDGRITRAVTSEHVVYRQHSLRFAAAALLPRLEATGQRLPLLKVEDLMELDPAGAISLLQPHTTFARLLAKCDRVELGLLELDVGSLHPAPAAVMELTAEQVLERAADKMWAAASVQGVASMAEAAMDAYVAAAGAADSQERQPLYNALERMDVLLRGPFVWQLTCGPGPDGGARLLTDWLGSLVAAGPPLPPAAAAPGIGVDAAAEASGSEMRGCSVAACGSGSAMAVVTCDCPFTALKLHRAAAAAAACKTPSCLQVSATRGRGGREYWSSAVEEVIRELWDDHLRSAPQLAAAALRAAAGEDGPADGSGGGGSGGPAMINAAGAGAGSGRAPGGQPAGDAAVGGSGGDDLQVLVRLLPLLEQAHAAVVYVGLDNSQPAGSA
ncbi:hypothetical protein HXX76_001446 [Chlamydomonas incerta]|uniref:Uncharacterized protein n=1 Tax=Chlamydomonas incerta TaxID=51695 RepID=A0A835WC94_CHLIN|nr:hypothetical protein HXX76_001446 [Chlamydomonas incerta]|eukprot:KAG2444702.1 hypothetical protein HXX76_001446 [Chlamydomonas incerta]